MPRVLLADDSPHAQRMGERILREGGHEVTAVMDGERALMRLAEVDPDVVLVDAFLPYRDGYELCDFIKSHPRFRHVRVVLTAGLLEPLDESRARQVSADAILKKPFEASVVVETLRPLFERARRDRETYGLAALRVAEEPDEVEPTLDTVIPAGPPAPWMAPVTVMPVIQASAPGPAVAVAPALEPIPLPPAAPVVLAPQLVPIREPAPTAYPDPELVRAAVTIALDAAMPVMIDELTRRVLAALTPQEDRKVNHG
ncbi:MAG: response regulator [Bryobacteraceae bacterium]|nr:response regulator [Bryobacteraceae bacterium]